MYEHHHQPLVSREKFLRRLLRHGLIAAGIILGSLGIGILGYHFLEGQAWIDAMVNAAMLLGGMGPVGELHTVGGKLFASFYALYAGLVFLVVAGVLLVPVFHRFMHHFHIELTDEAEGEEPN